MTDDDLPGVGVFDEFAQLECKFIDILWTAGWEMNENTHLWDLMQEQDARDIVLELAGEYAYSRWRRLYNTIIPRSIRDGGYSGSDERIGQEIPGDNDVPEDGGDSGGVRGRFATGESDGSQGDCPNDPWGSEVYALFPGGIV